MYSLSRLDRPSRRSQLAARYNRSNPKADSTDAQNFVAGHFSLGLANDPSFPRFSLSQGPWPVALALHKDTSLEGNSGYTQKTPKRYSKCLACCMTVLLISSHSPSRPSKATLEQANVSFQISHVFRIRSYLRSCEAGLRQVRTPPADPHNRIFV